MANSGLRGPFPLTQNGINQAVSRISAGAYVLGETRNGTFYISYAGRADGDVGDRLRDHITKHPEFKYEYYGSPKAAFEKECELVHTFSPPDNKWHPDRPNGSGWNCPFCTTFK